MSELLVANVDYEEARRLADLTSINQDLTFCVDACAKLIEFLQIDDKDNILIQSLWSAALISYARCFAHGKRYGLTEQIYAHLESEPIAAHQYYKNLRDKNIAHSVNPFEQVEVGLILSAEEAVHKEVLGVAILAMKHISSDITGVGQLRLLAVIARTEVSKMGQEYQQRTLEVGKALSIDKLYSRARLRTVAPGPNEAGKPR